MKPCALTAGQKWNHIVEHGWGRENTEEALNIENDKPRIMNATEYFIDKEVGVFREDLEIWLEFLYKARDLKEHRSGGNLTAICIEEGIVWIGFLYGIGGTEILPLERLISFIESRLPGLEYDIN